MKRVLPTVGAVLLALVVVSGCGDDGGNAPGDQPNGTQTTKDNGGGY